MATSTANKKPVTVFTVNDAALRFSRTTGRIRQICIEHSIGETIQGRVRLLSAKDLQKIGRIIEENGHNPA